MSNEAQNGNITKPLLAAGLNFAKIAYFLR